jgi:hypothetical protein
LHDCNGVSPHDVERRAEPAASEAKAPGGRPVTVIVADDHIDFLTARGYLETRDKQSIGEAVSLFLSDSVLEGA